jgi:cell division protein FtsQ
MPVAAPSDRRFRRAHVNPARRRHARRARWWVLARVAVAVGFLAFAGYRVLGYALVADALTVSRITVTGNQQLSSGEVLSLLAGMRGVGMVTLDLDAWRDELLALPWVEDVTLRRVLPSTVAVTVSEREPMAVGRLEGEVYLIDWRGGLIDLFGPNYASLDLPLVDGLDAHGTEGSPVVDPDRAALAARLLAEVSTRPALASRISQVDVIDLHDAVVILKDDTVLVRVGEERFVERLESYLDLVPALSERVPDIDYVDLRFDERVYVRPLERDGFDAPLAAGSGRGSSGS